jgi:hypothetical protein
MQVPSTSDDKNIPHPGFYRRNYTAVSEAVDKLLLEDSANSVSNIDLILQNYFGIQDVAMVSKDEKEDLRTIFSHLLKRTINGARQFKDTTSIVLESDTEFLEHILADRRMIIHDVFHSAARYIKDPENEAKDTQRFVPTPFKKSYTGFPEDRESLEEELFAVMWIKFHPSARRDTGEIYPLWILNKLKNQHKDHSTLLRKKIARKIAITSTSLYREYAWYVFSSLRELQWRDTKDKEYMKQYDKYLTMKDSILSKPHPKLLDMLDYIITNQNNPRVMMDLFFREMNPLIEEFKRRKSYIWEKRKSKVNQNPPLS